MWIIFSTFLKLYLTTVALRISLRCCTSLKNFQTSNTTDTTATQSAYNVNKPHRGTAWLDLANHKCTTTAMCSFSRVGFVEFYLILFCEFAMHTFCLYQNKYTHIHGHYRNSFASVVGCCSWSVPRAKRQFAQLQLQPQLQLHFTADSEQQLQLQWSACSWLKFGPFVLLFDAWQTFPYFRVFFCFVQKSFMWS